MVRNNRKVKIRLGLQGVILILSLLILLQIVSLVSAFPGPVTVILDLIQLFSTGLLVHLSASFLRVLISLVVAGIVGIALGYYSYHSRLADVVLNAAIFPIIESLPPLAWTILCVLVFGISQVNIIFIVSIILLQYFVVNMLAGMSNVDPLLIEMGRTFTSDENKLARYITAPMVAQFILPGIRIAYGVSWKVIVLAEMFGATNGLGFLINEAYSVLNLARVLSLSVLIVAIFWATERVLEQVLVVLFRWWQKLGRRSRSPIESTTSLANGARQRIHRHDSTAVLSLKRVSKSFDEQPVLVDISLTLRMNEILCIMGPTGCGKTTLLRVAAGLSSPDSGEVEGIEKLKGSLGFVFQEPRLLPWRTPQENVELPFLLSDRSIDQAYIEELITFLELENYAHGSVDKLSGGMQQRVSIARAMALNPEILLLDEPFKGLDILSRERAEDKVLELYRKSGKAVLFVTHDIDESIRIADRINILSKRPAMIREDAFDLTSNGSKPRSPHDSGYLEARRRIWDLLHNGDQNELHEEGSSILAHRDLAINLE